MELHPARGAEAKKRRPAVIVSNDRANTTAERLGRGVVTVVPLTSNTARVYPFPVLLDAATTGLERDSEAQAEQVRSVTVERIGTRVGVLDGSYRPHSTSHFGSTSRCNPGGARLPSPFRPSEVAHFAAA